MGFADYLPLLMFAALAAFLFTGYPVAFGLAGLTILFGFVGNLVGVFEYIELTNMVLRIWGGVAENLVLTAVPTFVFMGVMMERSGIAQDLLHCLQVLLKRVPGGLALSVTVMGTIMAAMTGIIGASVTLMSVLALPHMMRARYNHALACGTICASGTLGILIPPSILLVIMGDLMAVSVGNLFLAALFPGLLLSGLYFIYISSICAVRPQLAPPLSALEMPPTIMAFVVMLLRGFAPAVALILLIKVAIFGGWATPTEGGAVGAFGATVLALVNGRLNRTLLRECCDRTALTVAMIFFVFIGATGFSYVFRSLGGDEVVDHLILSTGLDSWGLLLVLMAIVFLLGFFLDWVEITLIVLPVFLPIVGTLEFGDHVPRHEIVYWFAILIAVNLQTSFLTPPFGFALFYMKGVAPPEVKLTSIYRGIIPFVLLQLIGLIVVIAHPDIALWLPRQLLD